MRHLKQGRKLGRTAAHRTALLRNLATALLEHGRIITTEAKAKELRRVTDKLVTLGKRGDLHARRQALQVIRSNAVVRKLFDEVAPRCAARNGGYTRVLRLGYRPGDAAAMAVIELVDIQATES
jgi:large subunit ribosomal protein L17